MTIKLNDLAATSRFVAMAGYYPVQVIGYDAAQEGDVADAERIVVGDPIKVAVS